MRVSWRVFVAVLANSLLCLSAYAEVLNVIVIDQSGNSVKNTVVSAYSQNKQGTGLVRPKKTVLVDQIDKEFVDHVTPIQVGAAVDFPNHDQIRHHVYSLSSAKTFEIPLYKGIPAEPVFFDQEGVVVLGCNIHDRMSAYIVVIDSPYFATTDEQGRASLILPAGDYQLRFWHRDANEQSKNSKQSVKIIAGQAGKLTIELTITPSWSSRHAPLFIPNRGRYR